MRKERNGKQHFRHACRCFEPSEAEIKIKNFFDYVVIGGMNKKNACKKSGLPYNTAHVYILPSKEIWSSLPEKGTPSKYTYIKKMQSFSSAKAHPKFYKDIMLFFDRPVCTARYGRGKAQSREVRRNNNFNKIIL